MSNELLKVARNSDSKQTPPREFIMTKSSTIRSLQERCNRWLAFLDFQEGCRQVNHPYYEGNSKKALSETAFIAVVGRYEKAEVL